MANRNRNSKPNPEPIAEPVAADEFAATCGTCDKFNRERGGDCLAKHSMGRACVSSSPACEHYSAYSADQPGAEPVAEPLYLQRLEVDIYTFSVLQQLVALMPIEQEASSLALKDLSSPQLQDKICLDCQRRLGGIAALLSVPPRASFKPELTLRFSKLRLAAMLVSWIVANDLDNEAQQALQDLMNNTEHSQVSFDAPAPDTIPDQPGIALVATLPVAKPGEPV